MTENQERPLPHDPDLDIDEGPAGEPRPAHLTPHLIGLTFLGGTFGVLLRAVLDQLVPDGVGFPATTFAINITGAFLLAVVIEALAVRGPDVERRQRLRVLLGTGVLGGFTTYSAFAYQLDGLIRHADAATALYYGVATVVLGLSASVLGIAGTRRWFAR